jgi:hypothetical protein
MPGTSAHAIEPNRLAPTDPDRERHTAGILRRLNGRRRYRPKPETIQKHLQGVTFRAQAVSKNSDIDLNLRFNDLGLT